ncbi:hypothetical protein F0562_026792 [Nyssa sinensis]|uniref:Uncharacterized protein n=1 Tax=Nyssa sinensis TaxID=561372 RepID=A0A5J5BCJ9_9ASTE|nr:hypothetical protein F0562_026792 [Nyssa sinensis]
MWASGRDWVEHCGPCEENTGIKRHCHSLPAILRTIRRRNKLKSALPLPPSLSSIRVPSHARSRCCRRRDTEEASER